MEEQSPFPPTWPDLLAARHSRRPPRCRIVTPVALRLPFSFDFPGIRV